MTDDTNSLDFGWVGRGLIQACRDAIIVTDCDGLVRDLNPAAAAMFETAPSAAYGRVCSEILPLRAVDGGVEIGTVVQRVLKTGAASSGSSEYEFVGDGRCVAVTIGVLSNPSGKTGGAVVTIASPSQALHEAEELRLMRFAFDRAADAILWADERKRFVFVNDAACRHLGYTRQELLSMSVPDISVLHDPSEFRSKRAILEETHHVQYESTHRHKSGRFIPIEIGLNLLPLDDHTYTCAIVRDISVRKQTEVQLRCSHDELEERVHERTRELANQKYALDEHALVAITNPSGKIIFVNEKFCQVSQYSRAELLGQDHRIINSGYHPSSFFSELWQTISAGNVWRGEICNRAKDGSHYWVKTTIVPFKDQTGRIIHYIAIRTNVTKYRRIDEELRCVAVEKDIVIQDHKAIGKTQNALWKCRTPDEVARVLTAELLNRFDAYFARVWLIRNGDRCDECALAEHCATNTDCLHLLSSSGRYTHVDGDHQRVPLGAFKIGLIAKGRGRTICNDVANDERVHDREWAARHELASFGGFPLVREGQTIGVMAMFSREKISDNRLDTLDVLAAIGSSALTSVQDMAEIRRVGLSAEAANLAKSDFLASMSHELRTPLTAIIGFAETMLEADQSESDRVDSISTIRRNGRNLLGIINDILDLSKIEAGKMTIECLNCQPHSIVAEIDSFGRSQAEAKGLSWSIQYDGPIPETINSDPPRLRQILINLIGNAIKFTATGSVRLVTRLVDGDKGDQAGSPRCPCLQFDVIDSGKGMTKEQASKLFQPFVQADNSTTRDFGGTGLGLVISKRFAEMLGGEVIIVATKVGIGTTFRATVATGPLDGVRMLDNPMSAVVAADTRTAVAQVSRSDLHDSRILLAEDGLDNQRLILFLLTKAGVDVAVVENGKLAFDTAMAASDEGNPFDVILMDMSMPIMDGYEAVEKLRQNGYSNPIIALTAHAMAGDREKCLKAGCDNYATKPIDRKKLIEMVQQYLVTAASSTST